MRYVIIIFAVTMFVIWESVFNNWSTSQAVLAEVNRVWMQLTR